MRYRPIASKDLPARLVAAEAYVRDLQQQLAADDALLVGITSSVGFRVLFDTVDLGAHADIDAALADTLGPLRGRRLGHRLQRLLGRTVGGRQLQRVYEGERGWVYEITFQSDPCYVDGDGR